MTQVLPDAGIPIDHDTPTAGNLIPTDQNGNPIAFCQVVFYLESDFLASTFDELAGVFTNELGHMCKAYLPIAGASLNHIARFYREQGWRRTRNGGLCWYDRFGPSNVVFVAPPA